MKKIYNYRKYIMNELMYQLQQDSIVIKKEYNYLRHRVKIIFVIIKTGTRNWDNKLQSTNNT